MPQFDTFSFFSQLFWVFVGFLALYLSICFYLLPALSSILKTRKRKLAQVTTGSESAILVTGSTFLEATKHELTQFNTRFTGLFNDTSNEDSDNKVTTLSTSLATVSVKFEATKEFNIGVFSDAQRTTLLYS